MSWSRCPRCSSESYETLKTHSYCVQCNYSPDLDNAKPEMTPQLAKIIREATRVFDETTNDIFEKNSKTVSFA